MKFFFYWTLLITVTSCKMLPAEDKIIADPNTTYKIFLNPSPGSSYYYDVNTNTEMQMDIDDKKVDNNNESTVGMWYNIEKDSAGNFLFSLSYDKVHLNIKNGDTETEADLSNAAFPLNPVEKMLAALKNANLKATVTQNGEIKELSGYKELSQQLMAGLDTTNAYVKETAQKQLDKIIGEGMVKTNLDQLFKIFPDSAIHVGDKWKLNSKQNGDFALNVKGFYKLKDINQDLAIIDSESEIESDETPLAIMGSAVIAKLKGTQNGRYEIEAKTGMLLNGKINSEIKGTLQSMGRDVPVEIKIKIEIEGKKIK